MVEEFKRQLDDPTTTLDGLNCTPDSTAMAMFRASHGLVDVYGGQVRARCMESGVWPTGKKDTTGGTNLPENIAAAATFGVHLTDRRGSSWADFTADVAGGRGAVVQGKGGSVCGFPDEHAEYVPSVNLVAKTAVVGDPICKAFKTIPLSALEAWMLGLGTGGGGLRYAVTPITEDNMAAKVDRIVRQAWTANGTNGALRTDADRALAPVLKLPAGTPIVSIAEATDKDGNHWRLAEWPVGSHTQVWFLRSGPNLVADHDFVAGAILAPTDATTAPELAVARAKGIAAAAAAAAATK